MIRRKNWYAIHRWLGLVVSVQLLAWSVGGFVFSVLDIADVRGESDATTAQPLPLEIGDVEVSLQDAVIAARATGCADELTHVGLRMGRDVPEYVLSSRGSAQCVVNAVSGEVVERISDHVAQQAALTDFAYDANVVSVTLLEKDAPGEYRGGELPAYRVVLDHPREPHIYVSAVTGDVTKRRNKLWRTFDFFWMLHIMDYRDREDFNHFLLTAMSVLAILTSASGLALWWWRVPLLRARIWS